jgi:hypothetical protein
MGNADLGLKPRHYVCGFDFPTVRFLLETAGKKRLAVISTIGIRLNEAENQFILGF